MDKQREPFKDGAAAVRKFAAEFGLRLRAGFNAYGFDVYGPAAASDVGQVLGFSELNWNGVGL